jgi:hypothetical protein
VLSNLEIGRAIVLGAVFGEMGCENGLAAGFVDPEISSSVYYLIGWIGFSFIPGVGAAACARDAVQYFLEGKNLQAALSLAGIIPFLSAFKVEGAVTKFIAKNPGKEAEIAEVVVEDALKLAPDGLKAAVLDGAYSGAATALNDIHKVPTNALEELANKGADLRKVKTLLENVYRRENGWPLLEDHFVKHASKLGLDPANLADMDVYFDMAVELINRPVGVEKYYDVLHGTLGVYERSTGKYVAGKTNGQIATFLKRPAKDIDYEPTRFIKLN